MRETIYTIEGREVKDEKQAYAASKAGLKVTAELR